MHAIELPHPEMPEILDELLRQQGWSWESVERGDARLNGDPVSVDDLVWWLMQTDPVLWTECNLVNRLEDGGGLWQLFDYQKPSLRCRGHVVHQDGAEVGKTREIVALICWGSTAVERGSILVGSALDGDLDEIWEELQHQISSNPYLKAAAGRQTTKPYRRQEWKNGLRTLFRPAGHDGRAYRGVHVRGFLLHDEAAKVSNPRSWGEFWRAGKPGSEYRIYSVPTGDRSAAFQRIADAAADWEKVVSAVASPRQIVDAALGRAPRGADARAVSRELGGRTWVRFHWPKTIMPAPFWSDQRRQEYVEMFGSADDPGFIHNVLGLPGDPEYSVFPSRLLDPAIRYTAEYRTVELTWDHRAEQLDIRSRRLNPQYSTADAGGADDDEAEGNPLEPFLLDFRDSREAGGFHAMTPTERREWVDSVVLSILPSTLSGFLTAGVDVGSSSVTEILLERSAGPVDEIVLRIQVKGWGWYEQRDLLLLLDQHLQPPGGWGLDSTGAGKPLLDLLQGDVMADRLSGFVFNVVTPAINHATGLYQVDPQTGRAITISHKELATQLVELALARRSKVLPEDPELIHLLQNHTYSDAGGSRRFSKKDDHVADAWRCLALRRFVCSYSAVASAPVVFRAPEHRSDAANGLRGYA